MSPRNTATFCRRECSAFFAFVVMLLAACGGGGDGGSTAVLPATLSLTAPTSIQTLGTTITFGANTADPALSYRWDFGDGTTSTLASPTHAYSKAGAFTVSLTLGNAVGGSLSASTTVSIADFAVVAGKSCSAAAQAGWCWQQPLPQGNFIDDYDFVDDTHGWGVGEVGSVLATHDGGVTWTEQSSGTMQAVTLVKFVDASIGWAAGINGEMLKTTDAGTTWQRLSSGQIESARTLGARDADTAWITTDSGAGYVTTDGGSQWRRIVTPVNTYKIVIVTASDFWSFQYASTTSLSHSIDAGATWQAVALPPPDPGLTRTLNDLRFFDPGHVLVVGYDSGFASADPSTYVMRTVLRVTADGGASWQAVNAPADGSYAFASYTLADPATWFAFYSGLPILRSVDAGMSWQPLPVPATTSSYVSAFKAFSAQRLLLTDAQGQAYLSTDGGAHWNQRGASGAGTASVNSLWFFDDREGLAINDDGTSTRTTDGGQHWVASGNVGAGWRRVQFLADASVGWVISDTGTIYRSTDKGHTWLAPTPQSSAPLYGVTDFHFVDALHGWAVAPYPYANPAQGPFFSTTDGGMTWQALSAMPLSSGFVSLRFADALHGIAVGPPGIALVTDDGGATWVPRPTGVVNSLRRVVFIDSTTAVAVGYSGAIVRSVDRGQTWNPIAGPTVMGLSDVRFVSPSVGHAVGDSGTELVTRDGGTSWTEQAPGLQANLRAVFFVDEQTGWIAGDYGSILATATGGD